MHGTLILYTQSNTKDAQLFYTENRQNSDYYKTRFAHIFF